jgi:hypothetical protein
MAIINRQDGRLSLTPALSRWEREKLSCDFYYRMFATRRQRVEHSIESGVVAAALQNVSD